MIFARLFFTFVWLTLGALIFGCRVAPPSSGSIAPVDSSPPADFRFERTEINADLQRRADALSPLFDRMPPVAVRLKDAPIAESGSNTATGNAYTLCDKNAPPLIFVKKDYYQTAHPLKLDNTLKHELTHAWLCRQKLMSVGHSAIFRRKLAAVGGWLNRAD